MKKFFYLVLLGIYSVTMLFSQDYDELLSKGKSYELNNEFVYALGFYYDAMNSENAGTEAREKYDALKAEILNGNPGYGDFNTLTMQKGWLALMKNYYKYFTEFCPFDIYYGKLELGTFDYQTETAEYLLPYIYVQSKKNKEIESLLWEGIEKNSRADWGKLKSGRLSYPELESSDSLEAADVAIKKILKEDKIALTGKFYAKKDFSLDAASFASNELQSYGGGQYGILNVVYNGCGCGGAYCMYDVQFDIYDENNNLFLSGKRQNSGSVWRRYDIETETISVRNANKYSFKDNGARILSLVEKNENFIIKPKSVFLNYGSLAIRDRNKLNENKFDNDGNYSREWSRQIFEGLPSIQIPLSNVTILDDVQYREDIRLAKQLEEQRKFAELAAEEERKAAELAAIEAEIIRLNDEEKKQRIQEFEKTGIIAADYAAEILQAADFTSPVIKITGDVNKEWNSIIKALSQVPIDFELDLSECKNFTILKEVKCQNIIGLILPKGCKTISINALGTCENLKTIILPNSIQIIGNSAFINCSKLESVNYQGSKNNWKSVEIGKNNNYLKKAKINFDFKY